jgi:DNA-binding protein HU-beta
MATKASPATVKEKSQSELIAALATASGLTQAQVKPVLEAHAALILDELNAAGSVPLYGLGKLKASERPERQGRNPSTGEAITIKAAKTVKFTAAKRLKDGLQ